MLLVDNPDLESADEQFSFWDLSCPAEHFFAGEEESPKALELDKLVEDFRRVERQTRELLVLMPSREETILEQWRGAADTIEAQIKKLLGREVSYSPEPQRKLLTLTPVPVAA